MPASRAAITVSSRASSSKDAGTVSTMSCSAIGAPFRAVPLLADFGEEARRNLHRREHAAGLLRIPGRILAVRSTSGFESQDLAECTSRVGTSAPCSRAYVPTGWPSSRNRNEGSVRRASTRPGATSCGISKMWMGGNRGLRLRGRRCRPAAELVVPRSMPISCRDTFPHVELQLPAPAVARHAPELEHAGFGDDGFEGYRHHFARVLAA